MPTATRTASASNPRPPEEIGKANSQPQLRGATSAKKKARCQVVERFLSAWQQTEETSVLSENDCLLGDESVERPRWEVGSKDIVWRV